MRVIAGVAAYVGHPSRTSSNPTFKAMIGGSTATWVGGLVGFMAMSISNVVGTLVLLSSPFLGGLIVGLLTKSMERAIFLGAGAGILGITIFTVGVAFVATDQMGILLIWLLGVTFSGVTGAAGGLLGCLVRRNSQRSAVASESVFNS